jgi:dipeptidase D
MDESTKRILGYFDDLCRIPRPSKHERRVSEWVQEWARKEGFEVNADQAYNVLIRVPGRGHNAGAKPLVLQGHLDIVCESTADKPHDCLKDPIETTIEQDWLTADRTTLGADNGIGVSIAMALAVEDAISHPPLELLFTTDEETGLNGAKNLGADFVRGRRMVNLDSEDEGTFTVGCAGGQDTTILLPCERSQPSVRGRYYRLIVEGLKGGHSGADIHLPRGNSIKILARGLERLSDSEAIRLVEIHGGNAHNAIPRRAHALIFAAGSDASELQKTIEALNRDLKAELTDDEREASVALSTSDPSTAESPGTAPITEVDSRSVVDLLLALPHGVDRMSSHIEGLVETSNNLATIRTKEASVELLTSQRSSTSSRLEALTSRIAACARLAGGTAESDQGYPAWEPDMGSALLTTARSTYRDVFNRDPKVNVIHAGLECGVIGSTYPGMDMLSLGPTIRGAHTPEERLDIRSVERVWRFLTRLVARIE